MQMKVEMKRRLSTMIEHKDFKNVQKQVTDIRYETGELVPRPFSEP
jgi:hypothetical protein